MAEENDNPSGQAGQSTPPPKPSPQVPDGYLHQDDVNRIIEQRLARERQQYQAQLSDLGFKDLDEVAKLKKAQAEREKQELEDRQQYKELAEKIRAEKDEELRKRDDEINSLRSRYLSTQAERFIVSAATKHHAVAPDQVAQLVRGDIRIDDDGHAYVVDQQGNRRTDGKGGDLTVDAYVEQFLTNNPHFKRAAAGLGAGGRSGGTPPASNGTVDLARAKRDPDYFLQHKEEIERRLKSGELTA